MHSRKIVQPASNYLEISVGRKNGDDTKFALYTLQRRNQTNILHSRRSGLQMAATPNTKPMPASVQPKLRDRRKIKHQAINTHRFLPQEQTHKQTHEGTFKHAAGIVKPNALDPPWNEWSKQRNIDHQNDRCILVMIHGSVPGNRSKVNVFHGVSCDVASSANLFSNSNKRASSSAFRTFSSFAFLTDISS